MVASELLAASIPSVLVAMSWAQNNVRLSRLESTVDMRFSRVESEIDRISSRVDQMSTRMDQMSARIEGVQVQSHADALSILKAMTDLHERVAKVEVRQGL